MVAFVPWWEGGGLTPRWCALLVLVPLALCRLPVRPTPAHWVGAAFLGWALLSLAWTPVLPMAVSELMKLLLIAGCFLIGAELDDPRPLYLGVACGVAVSGVLAALRVAGVEIIPEFAPPAGLFVNRNYLAEIGVVALILAVSEGWALLVPPLLCAALLPHSRGSLLALGLVVLLVCWRRARTATLIVALSFGMVGAIAAGTSPALRDLLVDRVSVGQSSSLDTRLELWRVTAAHTTLFGHGVGSFMPLYPSWTPHSNLIDNRPAQAHNEILHEASELGLPGIALLVAFFGLCLGGGGRRWRGEHLALVAILAIGLFSFPLHIPAVAAVAGIVAGRAARLRYPVRRVLPQRRADLWQRIGFAGRL